VFRFHSAKRVSFSRDTRLCHVGVGGLKSHGVALALSRSGPRDCKVRAGSNPKLADDSVTGDECLVAGRSFWV
jgi:hypothetical protein